MLLASEAGHRVLGGNQPHVTSRVQPGEAARALLFPVLNTWHKHGTHPLKPLHVMQIYCLDTFGTREELQLWGNGVLLDLSVRCVRSENNALNIAKSEVEGQGDARLDAV